MVVWEIPCESRSSSSFKLRRALIADAVRAFFRLEFACYKDLEPADPILLLFATGVQQWLFIRRRRLSSPMVVPQGNKNGSSLNSKLKSPNKN